MKKILCVGLLPEMVGGLTVSGIMKRFLLTFALLCAALPAAAQDGSPRMEVLPDDITIPEAPNTPDDPKKPACEHGILALIIPEDEADGDPFYECKEEAVKAPDYSALTPNAERQARLEGLFERLKDEADAQSAELIAEEIWALWLDSGSDTVNFILRRGMAAQTRGELKLARHMFDNVTTLEPDYPEGWARSSRLAYEEEDFSRALTEASRTLVIEPRHFYALWTMGNVFEKLGRQEEALEAYREAGKLYPELKAVKERLGTLESNVKGDVL